MSDDQHALYARAQARIERLEANGRVLHRRALEAEQRLEEERKRCGELQRRLEAQEGRGGEAWEDESEARFRMVEWE